MNKIIHLFTTDDTEDMLEIYSKAFAIKAKECLLNNNEIEEIKENIAMCKQLVQDLFVAEDKLSFATATITPHVEEQIKTRKE